ncbi:YncE family protein, partial [Nonomuraea basaltis]|uniref:YncE family protein n=1 Tax=Nonomuraea basaltis TaxID=2495887 RepID=UPI0019804E61
MAIEAGDALVAIDAATNSVVTTVSGISRPHNVQVSPNGDRVYAVSGAGMVAELDPVTYRLKASGPTGRAPAHVVVTPSGAKTYVTNYGDGTVSAYRTSDLSSAKVIRVGGGPHGARPTPDGNALVVANVKAETVDVVDTRTDAKTASVPVGGPPVQVAISCNGRYAYATVSRPPGVVKIDLRAGKVTARASVSAAPAQLYLTPDGRTLLSADQGTEEKPGTAVSLIDTDSMAVTGRIATGSGPHGLVVDPTGRLAWVTNVYDGTVSVLDLRARQAVATVEVGDQPNGISFATHP